MEKTDGRGITVAGRWFADIEDLEEACFDCPELADAFDELLYQQSVRDEVDTYYENIKIDDGEEDLS